MFAKIMSVYRGEESLAASFWLWLICPLILIFGLEDLVQSNSIAFIELSRRTESISIFGLQFDHLFSFTVASLRLLLLALVFFFSIGVVRSARIAGSRAVGLLATVGALLICVAVSAAVLKPQFQGSPDQRQIGYTVRKLNGQLPQPLGEWGTWERLNYADRVMSARFEMDRSKVDRIDWDRVRLTFVNLSCRIWKDNLSDSTVRKFEGDFYSGSTLYQTLSITPSECPRG